MLETGLERKNNKEYKIKTNLFYECAAQENCKKGTKVVKQRSELHHEHYSEYKSPQSKETV
jgi:hypothetical protein